MRTLMHWRTERPRRSPSSSSSSTAFATTRPLVAPLTSMKELDQATMWCAVPSRKAAQPQADGISDLDK